MLHFFRKFTSFWIKLFNHSKQEISSRLNACHLVYRSIETFKIYKKITNVLMINLKIISLFEVKSLSLVDVYISFWRNRPKTSSEWEGKSLR